MWKLKISQKFANKLLLTALLFASLLANSQKNYRDSLQNFIADYVAKHEVVKGENKKALHFFEPNEKFRFIARFEKVADAPWFLMASSGTVRRMHRVYGKISFVVNDTAVTLNLYQSQSLLQNAQYKDYLFLPFTDATTGNETYEAGRYIDLTINDIQNNTIVIDFNKAYNPYCAYVSNVYNCPIPPKENHLSVAINAGEKKYEKAH